MKKSKIIFKVAGKETEREVRTGLGFQAICHGPDSEIEFDCRKSDCGICIFRVRANPDNLSKLTDAERDFLKAMRADPDERLACQCRVLGDVSIENEY